VNPVTDSINYKILIRVNLIKKNALEFENVTKRKVRRKFVQQYVSIKVKLSISIPSNPTGQSEFLSRALFSRVENVSLCRTKTIVNIFVVL